MSPSLLLQKDHSNSNFPQEFLLRFCNLFVLLGFNCSTFDSEAIFSVLSCTEISSYTSPVRETNFTCGWYGKGHKITFRTGGTAGDSNPNLLHNNCY